MTVSSNYIPEIIKKFAVTDVQIYEIRRLCFKILKFLLDYWISETSEF